mgnify:CR=1 FL=1
MALTEDRVKEVGRRILASITGEPSLVNTNDDAGVARVGDLYILLKIDGYDAKSSLYPWCTLGDLGFRAITSAVSDIVAKGARPLFYAFSIGLEPSLALDEVEMLLRGIGEAIRFYGGELLNADTNISDVVWIDVAVVAVSSSPPITRRGVLPGSRLLLPKLGLPYICYYAHYVKREKVCRQEPACSTCCRPLTNPRIPEVLERYRHCIRSSMDISDTLSETLYELAELNQLVIRIDAAPGDLLRREAAEFIRREGLDPLKVLASTYEEYLPILVVDPGCVRELLKELRNIGLEYCLLYTSPSPRDLSTSRMPSSA